MPSTITCSLSFLISRFHSSLFSDWRRTVSSKFFDPQVSLISTEEHVLPRHARCVLFRLRCNEHSLLLKSYLSRIEKSSRSACLHSIQGTSDLILRCPATISLLCHSLFRDLRSPYDLGPNSGKLHGFWGSMVFRHVFHIHGSCLQPSEGVG